MSPAVVSRQTSTFPDDFNQFAYDGPPLISATIIMSGVFIAAAIVILGAIILSLFKARVNRALPIVLTVLALTSFITGYALYIANLVAQFTVNVNDIAKITFMGFARLEIATILFQEWPELLILASVAVMIRDRYKAYITFMKRPNRILLFTLIGASSLVGILLFVFPIVYAAFWDKVQLASTRQQFFDLENTYNHLHYAYVAFYAAATWLLILGLVLVKKIAFPTDKMMRLLTFGVLPLLTLRAIARVILLIIQVCLPLRTWNNVYALDLASTIVLATLFLAPAGIMASFFWRPQLWKGPGEHIMLGDSPRRNESFQRLQDARGGYDWKSPNP